MRRLILSGVLLTLVLLARAQRPYIAVLGVAQDGGYPQAGCHKACCSKAWQAASLRRLVSCIAIVDPAAGHSWMFDATPDFREQLHHLETRSHTTLNGIFLTHGHIGHYTGLMQLGREVMGAKDMKVYAMPRMRSFLSSNGPWDQLAKLQNISIQPLRADSVIVLNERIKVIPFTVPHRDEYTETAGYRIIAGGKTILFIPDIDKWEKWQQDIDTVIQQADYALIDATFFKDGELNRPMSEVPHPFVEESMKRFAHLSAKDKNKIYFIHFNHTNPVLQPNSSAQKEVLSKGFHLAAEGSILTL